MKIYERLKDSFLDKEYFISTTNNYIYILNYDNIELFKDDKIIIKFKKFNLLLLGRKFIITRKNKNELEIKGTLSKMEIINEI